MKNLCTILLFVILASIAKGQIITTIAGSGSSGVIGDGSPSLITHFNAPSGVVVDSSGNVFIAELYSNKIRKVDAITGIVSTYVGTGIAGSLGDNGLATSAQLNYPYGIYMDISGNLYIADNGNSKIRKVSTSGIITTIAGNGIAGYSGDNNFATSAEIYGPSEVTIDTLNNLYIADNTTHVIRKVDLNTGIINTYAGVYSTPGFNGDNIQATSALINSPMGLVTDNMGNLFFVDRGNNRVRRIDANTHLITTIVGSTFGFSGDNGLASNAQLWAPHSICRNNMGDFFISDVYNERIRKVNGSTNIITTIAGNGIAGYSGDNGPAINAQIDYPFGIAEDRCGNLYIADIDNNRIRKVWIGTTFPSVSISISPNDTVCAGTSVTFTATATNAGSALTYQWLKNGALVSGAINSTYTYIPTNGDSVQCIVVSSVPCAGPTLSNAIHMVVNPIVTPVISISAIPSSTVCTGTSVTYTATITNGGTIPSYQWVKNGVNVGTNSNNYTYTPNNGDSIRCVLTSNASCINPATVSSNTIHMVVGTSIVPTISIAASPNDTVCAGTTVTYTANGVGGGSAPTYHWYKNGVTAGTNSSTYTYTPNNLDSIRCFFTSNATCASPTTANSNTINMVVNPLVTPTISISVNPNDTVCAGTQVNFTAASSAGAYQWIKNGTNVGTNSNTYSYIPNNNDSVRCVLTSTAVCPVPTILSSNTVYLTVDPVIVPTISITGNTNVTTGTLTTYTATTNIVGGTYQWQVNTSNVGTNSSTYSYIPQNGDIVTCTITVPSGCYSPADTISNTLTIHVADGVEQLSGSDVHVYPNPTNDVLRIDGVRELLRYRVLNIIGATVQEGVLQAGSNSISTEQLAAGMYLLELTNSMGVREVMRVVKE